MNLPYSTIFKTKHTVDIASNCQSCENTFMKTLQCHASLKNEVIQVEAPLYLTKVLRQANINSASKVSKHKVFSGPNTGKYGPEKNSIFGHFSRSEIEKQCSKKQADQTLASYIKRLRWSC